MNTDSLLGLPAEEALALASAAGLCCHVVRTGENDKTRCAGESGDLFEDRVIAVKGNSLVVSRFRVRLAHEMSRRP